MAIIDACGLEGGWAQKSLNNIMYSFSLHMFQPSEFYGIKKNNHYKL